MSERVPSGNELNIESLQQRFIEFLKTFKDGEGNFKYEYRIKEMMVNSRRSVVIDYEDLVKHDPKLFEELINRPDEAFRAFSDAIKTVVQEFDDDYAASVDKFIPRLNGLPLALNLREISSEYINKLVLVEGILVKATPPKQKLFRATYLHVLPTGESHEFEWPPLPGEEIGDELERPTYCPICIKEELISEKAKGSSRGTFKLLIEKSKYRNWQKVVIQERPEDVPAGHIPRSIDAILTDDIVDTARPGDRVSVIGVVKLYKEPKKSIQPVFSVYLDVNNIVVAQRLLDEVKLGKEDEEIVKKLGRDPLIRRKIVASIAPSIHGLWDIKEAIALQLFGGLPKVAPDGTKIRGDIHILIVGDPGTAKSIVRNEAIVYYDERSDLNVATIGELIDYYIERFKEWVVRDGESEILDLDALGIRLYVPSLNLQTFIIELRPIKSLIRHRAPKKVAVVSTRSGRQVITTLDHSFVGYYKGYIVLARPHDALNKGVAIPVLTHLKPSCRYVVVSVNGSQYALTRELGLLIGAFLGRSGWSEERSSTISVYLPASLANVLDKLGFEYETQGSEILVDDTRLKDLVKYLINNPRLLLNSIPEFMAGFIDGYVSTNSSGSVGDNIRVIVNDRRIAGWLVLLISVFGVPFRVSTRSPESVELLLPSDYSRYLDCGTHDELAEVSLDEVIDVDVRDLDEVDPGSRYVYDISVEDNENFVAGLGLVIVHNSQLLQYVARIVPRGLYTTGKGSSAAGLCVSGDTMIYTSSGLARARDLVEQSLSNIRIVDGALVSPARRDLDVAVYDGNGVRYTKADYCYMLWSERLQMIETDLGIDLAVTPETKVMVFDNGKVSWKHAKELKVGDYLIVIRAIPELSRRLSILDLLPENAYIRISRVLTQKLLTLISGLGTLRGFAKAYGISYWDLYVLKRDSVLKLAVLKRLTDILGLGDKRLGEHIDAIGYRHARGAIKWFNLDVDHWFTRLLAHLAIKGHVRLDGSGKPSYIVYFTTQVSDLMNFIMCLEGFCKRNIRYKVIPRSYGYIVVLRNKLLAQVFKAAGVPLVGEKPSGFSELIFNLPNDMLSTFVRELYAVCGGLREDHVYVMLPAKLHAMQLSMVLRRFGVLAEVHELPNMYEVRVRDVRSLRNIKAVLGDVTKVVKQVTTSSSTISYLDINDVLTAVRVKAVSEVEGGSVYDLTVNEYHSFIANGYVVHNTAAVVKDKQTGEYFLEAGAMVLADGGTVCIDEIDKMRDEDRVAIHEAMEQGTVSIAKAGIVARLNARASVLAAGNPKYGRYISSRPISENINLPVTILSRFDLIFTLRDIVSIERDRSLVRYVLRSHERIDEVKPEIPPDVLRKYIAYARKYIRPRLTKEAELLIEQFYLEMRKRSIENPELPIAITTRQLEGLIRLAEAHARMALKNYVDAEDAAEAIRLVSVMLENVGLDIETGHIDIDVIMTGKPKSIRDKELIVKDVIKELRSSEGCAKVKDVVREAVKRGIDEEFVERYLTNLRRAGEIYEVKSGCIDFVS